MDKALGSLKVALPVVVALAAAALALVFGRSTIGAALAALGGALVGGAAATFLGSAAVLLGLVSERVHARRRLVLLERDKELVLRSIKELEYDASLQRLPAEEATRLAAPLRERALSLLREVDRVRAAESGASSVDDQIRAEVARRLALRKESKGDARA
jgi:hypothetical protein